MYVLAIKESVSIILEILEDNTIIDFSIIDTTLRFYFLIF